MNDQPTNVLITRPEPAAHQLAERLRATCAGIGDLILSPIIGIEPLGTEHRPEDYDAVIFTSGNGVEQVAKIPSRPGQTAFCVGDRTAADAEKAGYRALSAKGDAQDLIQLILSHPENRRLLHPRGEDSRGEIAEILNTAGFDVTSAIVYRQAVLPLSATARNLLCGSDPILVPLYSPNTAKALLNQGPYDAPLHIIAISHAVADVAQQLRPSKLSVVAQPDGETMVAAICTALGGMKVRCGP